MSRPGPWWHLGIALCIAAGALACSAPLQVWRADVDASEQRALASARLDDPAQRAQAHLALAWLCLLHGQGCGGLAAHGRASVVGAPDMALAQWTRALSAQVEPDIGRRAEAWLDLLLWLSAQPPAPPGPPATRPVLGALGTVAAEALARLAVRDRSAVVGALVGHRQLSTWALQGDGPADRWRRLRALGPLLPALHAPPPPADLRALTLQAHARTEPLSRRLYSGLATVRSAPKDGSWRPLPAAPEDLRLPEPLRTGRYRLPAPLPGVFAVRFDLQVAAAGPHTVLWRAERPLRLWLDGEEITPASTEAHVALGRARVQQLAAGRHQVWVATALAGAGELLELAVLPGAAAPAGPPPSWPAPVQATVAALLDPGGPASEELARAFGRGPLAAMLALEAAASLGPEARTSAEVLDRVLDLLPTHVDARIDRAGRARDDGNMALARRLLLPLDAEGAARSRALQRRADLWLERVWQHQADGLGDLAMEAAHRAVAAQPEDCAVWRLALGAGQDVLDRPGLRRLTARGPRCPQVGLDLAEALALTGQLSLARDTLREVARSPGSAERARTRARVLADTLEALSDARPDDDAEQRDPAAERWRQAQRALVGGRGDEAETLLARALLGEGEQMEPRRLAWMLGARPPWQGLTVDGAQVAARAHAPPGQGAALTWLLDQEIAVLLPGGGALRRVHQMVQVHTVEAADAVGEIRVPPDAELLFARTWTPEGTAVLPAETPDKESVSLRRVGPGAVVEYAQLQFVEPDDPALGTTRLPPFLFQAADGPVLRSEYVLLAPVGVTPQIAHSPSAPKPEIGTQGALQRWTFRHGPSDRYRAEPKANRPAWSLPMVRVAQGASRSGVVEQYDEVLASHDHARDAALVPWVRQAREAGRDPELWRRLVGAIAARIEQKRSTLMPGHPGAAATEGRGDRASLLIHLARRAGVRACLVRLIPLSHEPPYGAPDPDDFRLDAVTLALRAPGGGTRAYWIDPGVDAGVLDFLRPGLRGRPGLRLGCEGEPAQRALTSPDLGGDQDRREVRVELDWFADGRVQAQVRDTLRGAMAAVVRSYLRGGVAKVRDEVLKELAGAAFAGMDLTWEGAEGMHDDRLPLVLTYRVAADASPVRHMALDLGLYPTALGRIYARLAHRRTTLRLGHAWQVDLDLIVRHHGRPLRSAPPDVKVSHRLLSLQRTVEVTPGLVRVRHRLRANMGLVPPADYPEVAAHLRRMDQAETLQLRRQQGTDAN